MGSCDNFDVLRIFPGEGGATMWVTYLKYFFKKCQMFNPANKKDLKFVGDQDSFYLHLDYERNGFSKHFLPPVNGVKKLNLN